MGLITRLSITNRPALDLSNGYRDDANPVCSSQRIAVQAAPACLRPSRLPQPMGADFNDVMKRAFGNQLYFVMSADEDTEPLASEIERDFAQLFGVV